mgnify:CR=1 FL=1
MLDRSSAYLISVTFNTLIFVNKSALDRGHEVLVCVMGTVRHVIKVIKIKLVKIWVLSDISY